MALRNWIKVALGWPTPTPPPLPVMPPLYVITPFVRDAELWLNEQDLTWRDRRIRLVTPDRADRLRGIGGPAEIVWVNRHRFYDPRKRAELEEYVEIIRSTRENVTVREVWA